MKKREPTEEEQVEVEQLHTCSEFHGAILVHESSYYFQCCPSVDFFRWNVQ